MVLGLLTAIAACPAIIGTTEAVRSGQNKNAKERHRGQKTNLVANCVKSSSQSAQINGGKVVLKNHKVRLILFALQLGNSYSCISCTSKQFRTSTSQSKTNWSSKSLPATHLQATSCRTPNTTGAGKAKGSSRPLGPAPHSSTGYTWTRTPTR